jgi:hypothetical protein
MCVCARVCVCVCETEREKDMLPSTVRLYSMPLLQGVRSIAQPDVWSLVTVKDVMGEACRIAHWKGKRRRILLVANLYSY